MKKVGGKVGVKIRVYIARRSEAGCRRRTHGECPKGH
jgi:hypothetical protein